MSQAPRVTVITVTHNGSRFLGATIASVLRQSFTDFEYLIIDNASTDDSRRIADAWAARDARIQVIASPTNTGPGGGLNLGLQAARGEFVANLDHDDLAAPHRLAVQVAALDADPAVGVVGGWMRRIDEQDRVTSTYEYRLRHPEIHWRLMFQCEVSHSAATYRRALVMAVGGYSPYHHQICDYELFLRLRDRTRFLNIADYLVDYRQFDQQSSQRYRLAQHLQLLLLRRAIYQAVSGQDLALDVWHNFYRATRGEPLQESAALLDAAAVAEAIPAAYRARYTLEPTTAALMEHDCALWLLTMALRHRRTLRSVAEALHRRALAHAPDLWANPETRRALRRERRGTATARLADPRIAVPQLG